MTEIYLKKRLCSHERAEMHYTDENWPIDLVCSWCGAVVDLNDYTKTIITEKKTNG